MKDSKLSRFSTMGEFIPLNRCELNKFKNLELGYYYDDIYKAECKKIAKNIGPTIIKTMLKKDYEEDINEFAYDIGLLKKVKLIKLPSIGMFEVIQQAAKGYANITEWIMAYIEQLTFEYSDNFEWFGELSSCDPEITDSTVEERARRLHFLNIISHDAYNMITMKETDELIGGHYSSLMNSNKKILSKQNELLCDIIHMDIHHRFGSGSDIDAKYQITNDNEK